MKRRIFGLVLALLLAVSVLSGAASAADVGRESTRGELTLSESVGMLFSRAAGRRVECGVQSVNKYGNVLLDIPAQVLRKAGYEAGDVVTVRIGGQSYDMPFGTNYSDVNPGCMTLSERSGTLTLSINQRSFAAVAGLDETSVGMRVTITMREKAGYLRQYQARCLTYSHDRADYVSDEVFGNFRAVRMGRIGENVLYRSATGIDSSTGRAATVSALYEAHGIRTVVNLSESAETIAEMTAAEDFRSAYYGELFSSGCVVTCGALGIDFTADAFKAQLASDLREMSARPAPYVIHCREGKDRTGFAVLLLEALMGAGYEEMLDDYMLSFVNFYHLEKGDERYEVIREGNANYLFMTFAQLGHASQCMDADYEKAAVDYLLGAGMTPEEITALRACLSGAA